MQPGEIYDVLSEAYGPQEWWPAKRNFRPKDWEVVVGAVLTQNVNWNNVEKALDNMAMKRITDHRSMLKMNIAALKKLIRPAGFYNQKAERLKAVAELVEAHGGFRNFTGITRKELLATKGIGPETADAILSYACGRPSFVVDLYTRRLLSRLGLVQGNESYETIKSSMESCVNPGLYNEFHALIVEHSKRFCRKLPRCAGCPLQKRCLSGDASD
ncbi:MAG: endonuclease III domain-containing protein [Candidatus Aenigmatarchaeota archaeon]